MARLRIQTLKCPQVLGRLHRAQFQLAGTPQLGERRVTPVSLVIGRLGGCDQAKDLNFAARRRRLSEADCSHDKNKYTATKHGLETPQPQSATSVQ